MTVFFLICLSWGASGKCEAATLLAVDLPGWSELSCTALTPPRLCGDLIACGKRRGVAL